MGTGELYTSGLVEKAVYQHTITAADGQLGGLLKVFLLIPFTSHDSVVKGSVHRTVVLLARVLLEADCRGSAKSMAYSESHFRSLACSGEKSLGVPSGAL